MSPTPLWKKRFILLFGLMENLLFSGTILGWSAMNYILKSEGVYQYLCDEVKPQFQYKNLNYLNITDEETRQQLIMKTQRNSGQMDDESDTKFIQKLKSFNKELVDLLIAESVDKGNNMSLLEQLEAYQFETSFSLIYKHNGCAAQDKILNLIFTIGIFCMGLSSFVWGFLLDNWGLRIVRLIIGCFITAGSIFLCLTNSDRPYLLFPAVILLCLGGVPLRIANMQFANLYPRKRSTIISLYSGAFCASAVVFVALKYLYDCGLAYLSVTLLLVIASLSMFPFTLITLPADCVREESDDSIDKTKSMFLRNTCRSSLSFITPVTLEKFTLISSPNFRRKMQSLAENNQNDIISDRNNYSNNITSVNKTMLWMGDQIKPTVGVTQAVSAVPAVKQNSPPLSISLWSWAFNLHQWWFSWLITYMVLYIGSLNLWLERVTTDIRIAGNFAKIYGIAQIAALVLAPMAGFFMDWSVERADRETDPFLRKLNRVRAGFWPLFTTSLFLSFCLFCRFFDSETAIYTSIVFMTIFRAFLVAVGTAYLRIRFNGEHFNRLLGIMSTSASVVSLVQFPLFVWESQYPESAFWVNIFNCFCTLIAFVNPIYILLTPLQTYLLRKEEREEAEAKAQ